jgi:xanthine/CO dehydrogenase XdhC/CoxF family maturation factor
MSDAAPPADPLRAAAEWRAQGIEVALATVVSTWGSAPRQPGAQMCISARGDFVGSVSGGCVESAVIEEAAGVIESGRPKLLSYGVTNERAWEVGLACGGQVEVFVERVE